MHQAKLAHQAGLVHGWRRPMDLGRRQPCTRPCWWTKLVWYMVCVVRREEEDDDDDDEEEEEEEPEEEDPGPPPPPPRPPVKVTFAIDMETNFGDHLAIVGKHPLLGEWVPSKGVPMDWVEGANDRFDSPRTGPHTAASAW